MQSDLFPIEKYPQIKKLFGYDPNFKWVVTGMVLMQITMLFVMKGKSWPVTLLIAFHHSTIH